MSATAKRRPRDDAYRLGCRFLALVDLEPEMEYEDIARELGCTRTTAILTARIAVGKLVKGLVQKYGVRL